MEMYQDHQWQDVNNLKTTYLKIKSPLKRVKKDGLIRNILIVMGNSLNKKYLSILEKYLESKNLIHSMTARDSIKRIKSHIS